MSKYKKNILMGLALTTTTITVVNTVNINAVDLSYMTSTSRNNLINKHSSLLSGSTSFGGGAYNYKGFTNSAKSSYTYTEYTSVRDFRNGGLLRIDENRIYLTKTNHTTSLNKQIKFSDFIASEQKLNITNYSKSSDGNHSAPYGVFYNSPARFNNTFRLSAGNFMTGNTLDTVGVKISINDRNVNYSKAGTYNVYYNITHKETGRTSQLVSKVTVGSGGSSSNSNNNGVGSNSNSGVGTIHKDNSLTLHKNVSGYYNSYDSKNQINAVNTMYQGKYYIYSSANNSYNISKTKGSAGTWINGNGISKETTNNNTVNKVTRYIKHNKVNVRTGPSTKYAIINSVGLNTKFEGTYESNGWFKTTYNGKTAYISGSMLSDKQTIVENKPTQYTRYTKNNVVNVRSGPSTKYSKLGSVSLNTKFVGTFTDNGWLKTTYNGKTAYVSGKMLSEKQTIDNTIKKEKVYTLYNGINVRSGPGTSYGVVSGINKGVELEGEFTSNGWFKTTLNNRTVYISGTLVSKTKPTNPKPPQIQEKKETKYTNYNGVNVRSGPGTSYGVVNTVGLNYKFIGTKHNDSWFKTTLNNQTVYVSNNLLSDTPKVNSNNNNTNNQEKRVINYAVVNVRSGPGTSYSTLGSTTKGTTFIGTPLSNGWFKTTFNGKTAYISTNLLDLEVKPSNQLLNRETTGGVNVRSGPSTKYSKIGRLNKGTKIKGEVHSSNWFKFVYNGRIAYVSNKYLK